MTIQECYNAMGGDYAQIESRLPSAGLIKKFITKFLDDSSFSELCKAMKEGQREQAFRASHTLKGVSANLSFSRLLSSVTELTELLRPETDTIPEEAVLLLEEVRKDYELTVSSIRTCLDSADSV